MLTLRRHRIERSARRLTSILLCTLPTAWAQPQALEAVSAFVQHPTNCLINAGGSAYIADEVDASYSQALATAIAAIGGTSDAAIAQVQAACASQLSKAALVKVQP